MSNWQRLDTKIVYQNPYITVHEDSVVRPDGRPGSYGWVETPPSVFVLAFNEDDQILLTKQPRYTTGQLSWELPAGSTDGQDVLEAAKRELEEEAGYHADKWVQLMGQSYPWNGVATEYQITLIAHGLHKARKNHEDTQADDTIDEVKAFSWDEIFAMILSGEISDGQSIASIMRAGLHLGRIK